MNGLTTIKEIVEPTFISGYIEGEQPGSLLITAEVEEGKSYLVSHYSSLPGVAYLSDATAYGIVKSYYQELENGNLKHLAFPEFIRPLERQKDTAASLVAFLAELMEEGVKEIRTFATSFQLPRPVKAGVIACIAKGNLRWRERYWNETGFLSRSLVVSYSYSAQTEEEVRKSIMKRSPSTAAPLLLPTQCKVELPEKIAGEIAKLAKPLAQALYPPLHGFRMQKHLQRLAMVSALRGSRAKVEDEDFEKIRDMSRYFNLQYNQIQKERRCQNAYVEAATGRVERVACA